MPTIGIGAGVECDGQVLVWHDLLGLYEGHSPRFVKQYADLAAEIKRAVGAYVEDVREPGASPRSSTPTRCRGGARALRGDARSDAREVRERR